VFRIRGFYVGPGLLQNYMNKEILDMEKATNEIERIELFKKILEEKNEDAKHGNDD